MRTARNLLGRLYGRLLFVSPMFIALLVGA